MPAKSKKIRTVILQYAHYIILASNLLFVIAFLLSVAAWSIPPSKAVFISYFGLGFPILFFINLLYFIYWCLWRKWRVALCILIIFVFSWGPISTTFPIHFKKKELPSGSFKVLSYNVRGFNWEKGEKARKNPIFDYILKSKADIICFQEIALSSSKNKNDIISVSEFNRIMKDYPYHAIVNVGNRGNLLACYSKFPILATYNMPLESHYNGAVLHKINVNGRIVELLNCHLESNRLTSQDKKLYKGFLKNMDKTSFDEASEVLQEKLSTAYIIREKQARDIREYMDKLHNETTIVCGDFNDTPLSYVYKTVRGDLVDSFSESGFGLGISYNENFFLVRIDYIMHSKNMNSYNCSVDRVKYSDHSPISTYLHFK